jgi:hypothetical protein
VLNHRVKLAEPRPQGWYARDKIRRLVLEVVNDPTDDWPTPGGL